jgi:hypothetical protein
MQSIRRASCSHRPCPLLNHDLASSAAGTLLILFHAQPEGAVEQYDAPMYMLRLNSDNSTHELIFTSPLAQPAELTSGLALQVYVDATAQSTAPDSTIIYVGCYEVSYKLNGE